MRKMRRVVGGQWSVVGGRWLVVIALITGHCPLITAAELPSLFRGVVVTDSPLGVRVVSVEESSQAHLADLRPEDVIVRLAGESIASIDAFAVLSTALKGRANRAAVTVFRNGAPKELVVHLYSYPILRVWGIEFVPDYDIHFADPSIGREYWMRMGRGFALAGKPEDALNAYLNALHTVPTDAEAALRAALLLTQISEQRLRERRMEEGITALRKGVVMMERLFESPLTDEQLQEIKGRLQDTVAALRLATAPQSS